MMLSYQFWGEDLVMGFPGVVRIWIALPLDQVLEFTSSAMMTMVSNGLDLVLLFAVDYFGWGFRKVDPVFFCFMIRGQEACMKDVMNGPAGWQLELISDWRNSLVDHEGSMTFRGEFGRLIREIEVLRF